MQACMKDIVDQGEGSHAWNTAADSAHIFAKVLPESIQVWQHPVLLTSQKAARSGPSLNSYANKKHGACLQGPI